VPIDTAGEGPSTRTDDVVVYASNPHKKGLDIALTAWANAHPDGVRLVVTGIDPEIGRDWCNDNHIPVSASVDWRGVLEASEFRQLLRGSCILLAASRYEDHGATQLEALADGALLVTVPSAGPFEPLGIAKQLPGSLVAETVDADTLAVCLVRAIHMTPTERAAYRATAGRLTSPYSEEVLDERLRERVLPSLLRSTPSAE
jgi:glycosyltransferase involved in cell wall biosynthesis